jgi:hypothetical protein
MRAEFFSREEHGRYLHGFFFGALTAFNAFIWGAAATTFF